VKMTGMEFYALFDYAYLFVDSNTECIG